MKSKNKILIGAGIVAVLGIVYIVYNVYNVLDTFDPTQESAALPIDVTLDNSVQPGDETVDAVPVNTSQMWVDTLTDTGDHQLQDTNGNIYYINSDGNIVDDNGNIYDDATGEILIIAQ